MPSLPPPPPHPAAYAMSGVERSGVARTGSHSARVYVSINGVQRAFNRDTDAYRVFIESLKVVERPDATPSTASCTVMGFPVADHDEVIATLGSINNPDRLFAGTVLASSQRFAARPDYPIFDLRLIDYVWQLNREKVIGRFSGPADTIVRAWMARYAPEWSVADVEAGLPSIDEITFVEPVDLTVALTRLAARVPGARWKGTYHRVLYFRRTPLVTVTPPRPLTVDNPLFTLEGFGPVERDTSQQLTRVHMEGGGSEAAADVEPGATILPLTLAPEFWYGEGGGVVVSGPQRIKYRRRFAGGGGSLVGPGAAPLSAPTLALASGAGVTPGPHDVAVVFETAAGTTLPGPVASITVGVVPPPEAAPVPGPPTAGVGPNDGVHVYALTEVTAAGETTPSPVSAPVTTTSVPSYTVAPPTGAPSASIGNYKPLPTPSPAYNHGDTVAYACTFLTPAGETTIGPMSNSVVATSEFTPVDDPYTRVIQVNNIPYPVLPVTAVRLYRYRNGAWDGYVTLGYGGFRPDVGALTPGSPPGANTATVPTAYTQQVPLTDLRPASPLGTARNLYGTAAGGSQLKFIATLNTTDTSYLVTTTDAGLGANAPTVNTAAANQITTGFPLGPTGTTGRRGYMSPSTGGARKLAITIANNTAVTGTITASDATLAAAGAEPSSDTSGLAQPAGQVLAGATSVPVAGLGGEDGFQVTGGVAIVGNGQHAIRYGSITGNNLTGVPASGPGSIPATIAYGSQITAAPALIDVGVNVLDEQTFSNGAARGLRLATGTPTDLLGALVHGPGGTVVTIKLRLRKVGAPTGTVSVGFFVGAFQALFSAPGPFYSSAPTWSTPIDVATLSTSEQVVTFTLPAPVVWSGAAAGLVLDGTYAKSDTNYVAWHGVEAGAAAQDLQYNSGAPSAQTLYAAGVYRFGYQVLGAADMPIVSTIHKGDPVNLWVTVNDLAAQAARAAKLDPLNLTGGLAGLVEDTLQDRRLSRTEAIARAQARLTRRVPSMADLHYRTRDKNTHPVAPVVADLEAPTSVHESLIVQQVEISFQDADPPIFPLRDVQASAELFTFEQAL